MLKRRDTKPEKTQKSGLQHAAQRWHGARCSVERCVQLLARRVAKRGTSVQAGVPISCNAMFDRLLL